MSTIDKLIEGKINIDQAVSEADYSSPTHYKGQRYDKVKEFDDIDPSKVEDPRSLGSVRFYNDEALVDFVKSLGRNTKSAGIHSNFHGHHHSVVALPIGTKKFLHDYMHIGPMQLDKVNGGLIVPIEHNDKYLDKLDAYADGYGDPDDMIDFGPAGAVVHFHHAYPANDKKIR